MSGTISVPVELGGRRRNLRLGINALCELNDLLEKREGKPVNILLLIAGALKLNTLRLIYYVGLRWEDDELRQLPVADAETKVGAWLEEAIEGGLKTIELGALVEKALKWSFPDPDPKWVGDAQDALSELAKVVPAGDRELVDSLQKIGKLLEARLAKQEGEEADDKVPFTSGDGPAGASGQPMASVASQTPSSES